MKKNTYCTLVDCPFKDCEHYWEQLKHMPPGRKVSIANLYSICRRYIGWLVDHARGVTDDMDIRQIGEAVTGSLWE